MRDIFWAYARAFRSLLRRDVFLHLVWPGLLSIGLWITVAILFWTDATAGIVRLIQAWPIVGDWVVNWDAARVALAVLVNALVFFLFIPLVFVTSAILVSVFALPFMLDRVAATDYREMEQRRGGSMIGSVVNALWCLMLFLLAVLVTLPLWLIPGVNLILSVGLTAWLNQRCYRYDALMNHADKAEMSALIKRHRSDLYLLGAGAGVLAYVPVLNLVVPAFTGLAFVHYLLAALRDARSREGGAVLVA